MQRSEKRAGPLHRLCVDKVHGLRSRILTNPSLVYLRSIQLLLYYGILEKLVTYINHPICLLTTSIRHEIDSFKKWPLYGTIFDGLDQGLISYTVL